MTEQLQVCSVRSCCFVTGYILQYFPNEEVQFITICSTPCFFYWLLIEIRKCSIDAMQVFFFSLN